MKAWLIQVDAWDGATAVPVRMASHDDDRLCHLDGQTWWPVIEKLPTLRYDFFDGGFDAASITSPSGSFEASIGAIPALPALAIHDARIRLWGGDLGADFAAFTLIFDGRVDDQPGVSAGTMTVSFGVDDSWLDEPLLNIYAGTGGAEGGEALEGQVKPLALGAPRYAPATLIDAIDNIYQVHGHGAIAAVETAFERLNRFGASIGDAANFASLKAADIARGQWATCLAEGLVRFGAPPEGMLCFHLGGDAVGGWSRLPGDLCRRVAELAGGAGRIALADVAALNASRPWPLSLFVNAQTTARELIQRIALSVNAVAYIDWLGALRLAALEIGTPGLVMAADGSSLPPVAEVSQVAIAAPYWRLAQGAAVTWQVHALSDIAFSATLNLRGLYDPEEVYREGDIVTLPDTTQWLFVATTPATGSLPHDLNADWYRLSDAVTAAHVTYGDGQTVEALKPAEPGATAGAPAGTNVGGRPVEDVLDDLDLNGANWLSMAALEASRDALMLARTTLEGQLVGTVVASFKAEQTAENEAVAETFDLIGAKSGDGTAFVFDMETAKVTEALSLGQYMSNVTASFGSVTGQINDLRTVMVDASGDVVAKAVFALNVEGHVTGIVSTNDGSIGEIDFVFDRARFLRPNGTVLWGYDETEDVIVMSSVRVDTIEAAAVKTETIDVNSVTGVTSYGFPDALVNGVVTIAEITDMVIGDGVDGRALVVVNFTQDGTSNIDTAMRIITYVDVGSGYVEVRNHVQGVAVSSGNARWILPASFSVPILANGPVQLKVTAQPYSIPGAGTSNSSYARNIQIDVLEGFR